MSAPIDVFVTHAWRYHDDWKVVCAMLDAVPGFAWRNFSVPWYDPALDPNTEVGRRNIHAWLEGQIRPVMAVIFLDGVYATPSARKWFDLETELARRHGKPIVGLPARGQEALSPAGSGIVDRVARWDAQDLIDALRAVAGATPA